MQKLNKNSHYFKGYKLMREVYKKLGVFEPEDQIEFANYLINSKDYKIDKDNVAIWGWVNI